MDIIPGYNKLLVKLVDEKSSEERVVNGIAMPPKPIPYFKLEILAIGEHDEKFTKYQVGQTVIQERRGALPAGIALGNKTEPFLIDINSVIGHIK